MDCRILLAILLTCLLIIIVTLKTKSERSLQENLQENLQVQPCNSDSDCTAPYSSCITHEDGTAGKCMQLCESNDDCDNGACGRITARDKAVKVCCPSDDYSNYAGFDYCTQMPEGSTCFSDAHCETGGQCDKNPACGDTPTCMNDECAIEWGFYLAECAITKTGVHTKGTCTASCDPSSPEWSPGAICVYGNWCRPERTHKTPTGEIICCPENTYYDSAAAPEGCMPYGVCSPERIHRFKDKVLCCPQESYYDSENDVCLPYDRCKVDGKWTRCGSGTKCDLISHTCN